MAELMLGLLAVVAMLASAVLVFRRLSAGEQQAVSLDSIMQPQDRPLGLARLLRVLNIQLRPALFIGGVLLVSAAVFSLFLSVFPTRFTLALVAALILLPVTLLLINDLAAWRSRQFETALVDVVDLMYAAAAGGTPPLRALQVAADGAQGFVRKALYEIIRRLELGASVDEACKPLLRLYSSEGVRLFADTLASRWHAGGDFEGLLQALGNILRERSFYRQRMQGQLSGARYALLFAGFFPYILIPFFLWKEPDWLIPLTQEPLGPTLMLSALLCQICGFLWMRRILRSDE
ncbi:type II secretion system F family protein [uncultured Pseudomonas sp.]|uniref:type II secretion system F family protein n=1 Tax=uncultured Pseudomonas sp. TaxID=114707 RepID=UPI00260E6778|nr:type II secretion system F family protein [uncultured Pseudomonas sp.]